VSFHYYKDTLPSGLRVVTLETPHLHSAMVTVYVRVGSRHETQASSGASHLLEHLFFRGSRAFPNSVRMNASVEAVGGNLNGVTTRDLSYYYTPVHPDGVPVALDVLGDMLSRPLLKDLALEKSIVLEEMLDEVDDRGEDVDVENLAKRLRFGDHPLGLKIAGTSESVKRLRLDQLKAHFARHYVTGNLVVAVAGPVKRAAVVARARRAFRFLPRGPPVSEELAPPPPKGPRLHFVEQDDPQTQFRLSFPSVPEPHPDFTPVSLLRRILDDGLSSRLPYNVVERRGLAYSVGATVEAFQDAGAFEIDGASAPHKVAQTVREVLRTLRSLRAGHIAKEELERARTRFRMSVESQQDSVADLTGWFAGDELFHPPVHFEERCRRVEAVTKADLVRLANTYLSDERLLAVAVGPRSSRAPLRKLLKRPGLSPR